MRLDSTPLTTGGFPSKASLSALDARQDRLESDEATLQRRSAELDVALQGVMTRRAALAKTVDVLAKEGVAIDDAWQRVFEDPRVNVDPACEALAASAAEAQRAAMAARARAVHAGMAELTRRAQIVDGMRAAAQELEARAQGLLEQIRESKRAQTVDAPPIPLEPKRLPPPPPPRTQATKAVERRVQRRTQFEAKVDFESDHNFFTGFTSDISEGGLFIATVDTLPLGSRIEVTLSIGDGPTITVPATVRWIRDILDDVKVMPGIGVQFESLPEYVRRGIHDFIGARDPLFMA